MKDSHEHPHQHEHEHEHVHGDGKHSHPHLHEHLHSHGHQPLAKTDGEDPPGETGGENGHYHEHKGHAGTPHFHGHELSLLSRLWRRLTGRD